MQLRQGMSNLPLRSVALEKRHLPPKEEILGLPTVKPSAVMDVKLKAYDKLWDKTEIYREEATNLNDQRPKLGPSALLRLRLAALPI